MHLLHAVGQDGVAAEVRRRRVLVRVRRRLGHEGRDVVRAAVLELPDEVQERVVDDLARPRFRYEVLSHVL